MVSINNQVRLPEEAFKQINDAAIAAFAWWAPPPGGDSTSTSPLSQVKQKADEAYEDFVARLMGAVWRVISNKKEAIILIKYLAFENANSACQSLLRPIQKTGSMSDFIRQCADDSPAYSRSGFGSSVKRGNILTLFKV